MMVYALSVDLLAVPVLYRQRQYEIAKNKCHAEKVVLAKKHQSAEDQ